MGTHPIFESDFDCLTETPCRTVSTVLIGTIRVRIRMRTQINLTIHRLINNRTIKLPTILLNMVAVKAPLHINQIRLVATPVLGMNFDHIYQKTIAVLNPWRTTDSAVINEVDLTGPFVNCMALGTAMLMVGKVQFGFIYGIGA